MILVALFFAGLISEYIVTRQTRSIAERLPYMAGFWAFAGWMLWGLVLSKLVVDYLNVIPFAFGAAIGTFAAIKLHLIQGAG